MKGHIRWVLEALRVDRCEWSNAYLGCCTPRTEPQYPLARWL